MKPLARFEVTTPSDCEIRMTREFAARRELVFECFTSPALVQRWLLGPDGWTMPICEIDLRVGGSFRYVWRRDSDGTEMGMRGRFVELARPERIVHLETFDDPWYPGEARATTEFAEHQGRTTVTMTLRYDSKGTRDGVLRSGMERGVEASYQRLETLLAARREL